MLIIDDEVLIRNSLARLAESKGHEVLTEGTGRAGLRAWRQFKPHLVFLDVLIPELDGPSVLRLAGKKNNEKVVLMSAHRAFDTEKYSNLGKKAFLSGVDLFLSKPFQDIEEAFKQAERLCFPSLDPVLSL